MGEEASQANEVGYLSAWMTREGLPLPTVCLVFNAVTTSLSIPLLHLSSLRRFLPPLSP